MRCSTGRCGRPVQAARILLVLLLQHLDGGDGPLVFGIRAFYQSGNPGTASRRQDQRSGHLPRRGAFQPDCQLVKASGLRWISLMWLGHVPWAGRHWALPAVLTVLAPSTRYYQQQGFVGTRSSPTGRDR